jgi:hypothetical protein
MIRKENLMPLLQIYLYLSNLQLGVKKVNGFEEPVLYDCYDLTKQDLRDYVTKYDFENTRDYYVVNGNSSTNLRERVQREEFIEYFDMLMDTKQMFLDCYNFLFDGLACEAAWDHPKLPGTVIFKYFKGVSEDDIELLVEQAKQKWPKLHFNTYKCDLNDNVTIVLSK